MDPKINVNVYVVADDEIDVDTCECDLNPVRVRVGRQYSTNALRVFLSLANAEKLYALLGFCLRDRYIVAQEAAAPAESDAPPVPSVRIAE